MRTDEALRHLERHQALIRDQLLKSLDMAHGDIAGAHDALAKSRWQMFRLVREYQLFKHGEIFDPIFRTGNPARVPEARRLKAACVDASERYRTFTVRWSASGTAEDPSAYRVALDEMASGFDRHLRTEREAIAALLRGAERIRTA